MRRKRSVLVVLCLVASGAWAATRTKSVWTGVYTDEQAAAGEKIYFSRCATCHGDDLGGVEKAPALVGSPFKESWHGKTLRKLLERIESMPPDEPQAVSTAEAVKVLAFLLRSSEMPSGSTALPSERPQLADITFERTKP